MLSVKEARDSFDIQMFILELDIWDKMYWNMRKRHLSYMQTSKAQISLRIHTGWSGPSLSADMIIWIADSVSLNRESSDWTGDTQTDLGHCSHMV